tara:strand:- start:1030 stop:1239 length:210 start_codon:yes stop_codon:yes gene_type:complete
MTREDIKFMLNNYEHNLEETVGLIINEGGTLCEILLNTEVPVIGLHGGTILEQGGYGLLIVDYIHHKAS